MSNVAQIAGTVDRRPGSRGHLRASARTIGLTVLCSTPLPLRALAAAAGVALLATLGAKQVYNNQVRCLLTVRSYGLCYVKEDFFKYRIVSHSVKGSIQ